MQVPTKIVTTGKAARDLLLEGTQEIAGAVGSTLGPLGRLVIIETPYGATTVTKDGVTVAQHLSVEDPIKNLAISIIKQAAGKTATVAGDGTTTSTVLAAGLVKRAHRLIDLGFSPIAIKRTFSELLHKTKLLLDKQTKQIALEDVFKIASISANNDEEIGSLIAEAYSIVGTDGLITIGESKTGSTNVEVVPGARFARGYASPAFVTSSKKMEAVLDEVSIFITDSKLRSIDDVLPILENAPRKPLLIIADAIDGQALNLLAFNKARGNISVCAIESPSFGENRAELLKDIAALTSARIYSPASSDLSNDISEAFFGKAAKVIVSKDHTTFIEPLKNERKIKERVESINGKLAQEDNAYMKEQLLRRLADLTSKTAIINVGAPTETEIKEVKMRVDDALRATVAAVTKGHLPGGGIALINAAKELKASSPIEEAFVDALKDPFRTIVNNASKNAEALLERLLEMDDPQMGYNARLEQFISMEESGVIDPALVVEQALTNAVSAASMILMSDTTFHTVDRTPSFSPPEYA